MDWVKQRSDYFLRPDIAAADDAAEVMFTRGNAYCGLAETSGFIAAAVLPMLGRRAPARAAAALVAMGRWELADGGFRVVGWAEDQADLEAFVARKKRDAARHRRGYIPRNSADVSADFSAEISPPLEVEVERETTTNVVVVRDDVERICQHLADRVTENGSRPPRITKRWQEAGRLLLDHDERTEAQVHAAIDWCQSDEFWRANILSMPTLREQYDKIRLAAQRTRTPAATRPSTTDTRVAAGLQLVADLEARGAR